eukprot:c9176_g1_i1.p1 GENE.c9176_g1_i1~~c9176_g1_i1.p1  ORF type:complete len:546 (-),score=98.24 c9176_g1_i1:60-1697(-)
MSPICVLLFWFGSASSMLVISPDHLAKHIETPIYNRRIGSQDPSLNLTALTSFITYGECASTTRRFDGRIVLIDNNSSLFLSFATEQREAECLESKGAIGIVRLQKDISVPGMFFNLFHGGMTYTVTGHVLTALLADCKDIVDAVRAGTEVTLQLAIDKNRWQTDLWGSTAFLVTFRIFLPILDMIGILSALKALHAHWGFSRLHVDGVPSTIKLMRVGCAVEFCCCVVRFVYCVSGPLLSSRTMSFGAQMFLPLVTVPFETTTKLAATYLFLRWGAFGPLSRKRHLVKVILFIVGSIIILLQFTIATLQTTRASALGMLLVVNATCEFIILLITAVLFMFYGRRFVRQLKSKLATATDESRRSRQLKRATYWIMFSGVTQLFIMASLLLAGTTDQPVRPNGFHATLFLIYFGASVGSIAQSEAFTPFDENVTTLSSSLAKSVSRFVPQTSRAVSKFLFRNKVSHPVSTARAEFGRGHSVRLREDDEPETLGELRSFETKLQDLTSSMSKNTVLESEMRANSDFDGDGQNGDGQNEEPHASQSEV